jgi:type II secretory pathway component PulM
MARSLLSPQVIKYISELSPREIAIGAIALVLAAAMGIYSLLIEPTAAAFERQSAAFKDLANTTSVDMRSLRLVAKSSSSSTRRWM